MPYAMTSWLRWVSNHMDEIRGGFPSVFRELRAKASCHGQHHKLPEQAAYLQFAIIIVSRWMKDMGVLNDVSATQLTDISWNVLTGNISRQSEMVQEEDPVNIFLETLETLIIQEKVSLQHRMDNRYVIGSEKLDLIGYVGGDVEWLYLIPGGVWNAVKRYLMAEGSHFPVSKNSLFKMMKNRGTVSADGDKSSSVVKVKDHEGVTRSKRVLQLKITDRLAEAILQRSPFLKITG